MRPSDRSRSVSANASAIPSVSRSEAPAASTRSMARCEAVLDITTVALMCSVAAMCANAIP